MNENWHLLLNSFSLGFFLCVYYRTYFHGNFTNSMSENWSILQLLSPGCYNTLLTFWKLRSLWRSFSYVTNMVKPSLIPWFIFVPFLKFFSLWTHLGAQNIKCFARRYVIWNILLVLGCQIAENWLKSWVTDSLPHNGERICIIENTAWIMILFTVTVYCSIISSYISTWNLFFA